MSDDEGEYGLAGIAFEPSYALGGSDGHTYKVKVEAVDAAGNVGPMSEESEPVKISLPISIDLRVLLEGSYDSGKTMKVGLVLPTTSPYEDKKQAKTIPEDAVDWICIELRLTEKEKTNGVSMFLLSNGSVMDYKGKQGANFYDSAVAGEYYVVVRHRNHLAIMSKPVLVDKSGAILDLTVQENIYGESAAKELAPGIFGMYAGDADANGQVQVSDKNDHWRLQVGSAGYKSADFNLDGEVQVNDKNDFWRVNVGKGTQVPEP